ncbi:ferritin-like domain-containing protein [Actinokineospora sp. PR83]|uniref:ferritin-like domain-containing protein n=1 Tax=Actinokineospora sp. PR83 TaxID=2884908 RepID=UPI001F1CA308|nr:ferritin-like domain-containing protein [Actinokineospora sp. PR83]MCG8920161.1 ferritin-like domain-containing protein [Actinokineospora sp. PR83]
MQEDPGADAPTAVPSGAAQPTSIPATRPPMAADTLDAVQAALGAEHAAVWVYGLVSAFLPASFDAGIDAGALAHRARRDATERLLGASGATPRAAEPAYLPPQPVTDQASALALLITAEQDATVAWRAVLDRTDDADVRAAAAQALTEEAVRATKWRIVAGVSPATPSFPGRP